jgi:hypothetical protein
LLSTSCYHHRQGRGREEDQKRAVMSKKSKRIAMILIVVVMVFLALAQHFGWIAGPPPLLAPGVH